MELSETEINARISLNQSLHFSTRMKVLVDTSRFNLFSGMVGADLEKEK
jgi:hypothetical protein